MRPNLQPIRILIVDAHAVMRRGLRMLLDMQPDIQVVGEAGALAEAQQQLLDLQPELVLLDLDLPEDDSVVLCRLTGSLAPGAKLLILTGAPAAQTVYAAVDAGVHGYALKEMAPTELAAAIRQVAAGKPFFHADVADVLHRRTTARAAASTHATLTPRELDVLALMATTATNREIAAQLTLAEETVRSHVKSILRKLNARNRTQAVVEALRLELIHFQE